MSHRTAATALLLASLPYGLALPQAIPVVSNVTRVPRPLTLPYEPGYTPPTVTVVGTVVEPTVDPAALETLADIVSDVLPEDALPTLDATANILPLILPGILPVETDLPPIDTPDVVPSDLPVLDPGIGDGTLPVDDLPDTNDLEVIDLPAPSEVPYGDDGLIADPLDPILSDPIPYVPDFPGFPDFPDFPEENTVPISTFNAVVQPLISVIQTLLNSLPGNFAPPLPGIFVHPLLPTETPDIFIDPILPTETPDIFVDPILPTETPEIFIDPLLPTETLDDAALATATDTVDSLLDSLVDSIPFIADSVATDLPFAKRQIATDDDTNSILAIIGPIIEAINALIAQIPVLGPAVAGAVSDIEAAVPELADLPVDVPAVPVDTPELPIPDITLPDLSLPSLPADLPVDVPAIPELPLPELPIPSLSTDVPELPVEIPDVTSGIPDEVLNVPVPDIDGIDWSQYESPPFSDLPAPSLDDLPIPDDVLNIPVPDFDEFGVPIEAPLDDASGLPAAMPSLPLPTSLDDLPIPDDVLNVPVPDVDDFGVPINGPLDAVSALPAAPSELPALLDWPFNDWEIPDALAPDVNGELPDLSDLPTSDLDDLAAPLDVLTALPAPTLPTDVLTAFPAPALPTELSDLPLPTDLFDVPVPEGFEDLGDLPVPTDVVASLPLPTLDDLPVPDDVLNIPVPDLDEFGVPLDLPTVPDVAAGFPTLPTELADLPLPTDFLDIPVPEGFEDLGAPLDLPAPALPTDVVPDLADLPIPADVLNIPVPDLDDLGVPLELPTDLTTAFPTGLLDVPVPEGFEDLGAPLDLPAATLPTDAVPDFDTLPIPADVLNVPVPDLDSLGVPIELPSDLPAPALPVDAFGAGFPIQALPDIPLELPSVPTDALSIVPTDVVPALPTEALPTLPALPTEALPAVPTVALPIPALPVPEVPAVPALPVSAPAVPAIPALPVVPTLQGIVPTGVSAAPAVPVVPVVPAIPTLQGIVPKLPFQVPGQVRPLAKREMMATQAAQTAPAALPIGAGVAFALIKPLLSLVSALLATLPVVGKTVPDLGANWPAVPSILPALPAVPVVPGVPDINSIVPSLPVVPAVAGIVTPALSLIPLPAATGLGSVVPVLPALPDIAGILPTAPAIPDLASVLPDVASILPEAPALADSLPPLPDVGAVASTVTGAVSAIPGISEVVSTVGDAAPKVPLAFDSGLTKRRLPLARRAVEEMQQGPASDWESFLGELDESKQEELHGLIHDSAAAVNYNRMDGLASTLKADFEDLSDASKAKLLNGWAPGPVLTAVQERSMRNGKRQAGVPGAQSLGPDLDDAQKTDLSAILGHAGTLDPFNQLQGGAGNFADDLPEDYLTPSQAASPYAQLDDSSVAHGLNPSLSAILGAAGTLDPNGMLGSQAGKPGTIVDETEDPYADLRPLSWDSALDVGSKEALPGLEATIQAAKGNHVGQKVPKFPFAPQPGGSAAAAQAQASEQARLLKWFNRFVRPSGRSDVDATIVQ
ncbi:hypothetical protein M3J07_002664 [Ascochyta lentis]